MRAQSLLRFGVLFLATFAIGCGPKKPDVMGEYQQRRFAKMALSVVSIEGTLRDSNGNGVTGVSVTAESPRYAASDRTANDGYFEMIAKFAPDDLIDFRFTGPGIEWTETLRKVPPGIEKITLRFHKANNGVVRLASLEY